MTSIPRIRWSNWHQVMRHARPHLHLACNKLTTEAFANIKDTEQRKAARIATFARPQAYAPLHCQRSAPPPCRASVCSLPA
eukprot:5727820-Pleurochrysis_carterae.AAC.1